MTARMSTSGRGLKAGSERLGDLYTGGRVRKRGIHLIWVSHDLMDPRVVPRQSIRDDVSRYMRTIMMEEPLDPSLEVLDDAESW